MQEQGRQDRIPAPPRIRRITAEDRHVSGPVLRVFVSATTQDLGSCRGAAKEELLTAGFLPVTQENFGPDYLSLSDFLRSEIAKSDAVICLIGQAYGAAPQDYAQARRSYTQLEYDLAIECRKPTLVFLTADNYAPDSPVSESEEEQELQRRHREHVTAAGHKWELFSDVHDLRIRVARSLRRIGELFARPPIFYRHLPRMPAYFSGRAREMQQLHAALSRPAPAVIAVVGMGGQGKTTLVHRALLELRSLAYAAGFWCTAYRGGFTFDMFLDDVLAYLLKGDFDKRNAPDVTTRTSQLLSLLQQQPVLLVIDGVERWLWGWNSGTSDPQCADTVHERTGFHPGLDDFLQQASGLATGSHLVLTTRALPAALDQAAYAHIPVREEDGVELSLEGLDPAAAVALLQTLGVKGPPQRLSEIAASYAYHPLALTILGALLNKKHGGNLERLPEVAPMDPSHELHKLFDEIRANLPGRESAERFLKVASQCIENPSLGAVSAGIGEGGVGVAGGVRQLLEEAVMLADWSLVSWEPARETVALHPLVKSYFGSLLSPAESADIHRRLSQWYGAMPTAADATSLEEMRSRILALRHAIHAHDLHRAADLMLVPMAEGDSLFTWLGAWGHQLSAIALFQEMADGAEGELRGIFLLAQAQMYHQLARSQLAVGSIGEAIAIFAPLAAAGSVQALSNLAKSYATRAIIHRETGDSSLAVPDCDRAVEILENVPRRVIGWHRALATTLANRGSAWRAVGALSTAIRDYGRALEVWREPSVEDTEGGELSLAPVLTNRGIAFLELGDAGRAIADFEESISICAQPRGHHRHEATRGVLAAHAKSMLATALTRSGQHEEALVCASEAVAALQTAVDGGRRDLEHSLALALVNRAKVQMAVERWPDALEDLDRSVSIYRRLLTEAGPHFDAALAHALCARAAVRHALGDPEGSVEDRDNGFGSARQLMREWPSESEIQVGFLSDALGALTYLLPRGEEERVAGIDDLLQDIGQLLPQGDPTEAMRGELLRSIPVIEGLILRLQAAGYEASGIQKLREKVR
jgi:tetratricopeptide (TPR) repeat protein